jgi:uncharacterized SAM-binding protein YcdF (DUF218 family)
MQQPGPEGELSRPRGTRGSARARGWFRLLVFAGLFFVMIAALGFVAFASGIPRNETKIAEAADGIVVLTGGASRVVDAVELLASKHGKRLLISGVNPSTTTGELTRVNPEFERLFECCIDLGHEATNTIGNAVETGRWAREQKFRSLIVVTSGWHMPRALIEIENELPEARLIPYPVVSERMREDPWWSDGPTVRLLLIEYVKYVASFVRVRLDPARFAGSSRRTHS